MNKLLPLILAVIFFASCNNNADKKAVEAEIDSADLPQSRFVWMAGLSDSTGRLEIKQVTAEDAGPLTIPGIVSYLNQTNPEITLQFLRTSNDTVFLKIEDATYLTQRMGSSGPETYLATVIYNLTELPGTRYINLDFEEGDHASPGTFERLTFKND